MLTINGWHRRRLRQAARRSGVCNIGRPPAFPVRQPITGAAMSSDPNRRPNPRSDGRQNIDVEQDTGKEERVPRRDRETERTVGPEDEDRERPAEQRR